MNPPDESREITREVHEHEIFLSFTDDKDAELFSEWWNTKGWPAFEKWAAKK